MPPRTRKTAPADPDAPVLEAEAAPVPSGDAPEPAAAAAGQPCAVCFPHGWPEGATSAACSLHGGSWQREVDA